jgi:hypothetical protein
MKRHQLMGQLEPPPAPSGQTMYYRAEYQKGSDGVSGDEGQT